MSVVNLAVDFRAQFVEQRNKLNVMDLIAFIE